MPRPFEVDPAVMDAIRPMQAQDADAVAQLHQAAMGASLWSQLGPRFLRTLYRALIDNRRFLAFVFEDEGRVRGFIAGTSDAQEMMSEVFRSHWPLLAMTALPNSLKPNVIRHLVHTARYFDASGADVAAESLFCSFEPELRGRRISGHINKVLFDELLSRGHTDVKITTEIDNKGANRQLTSWGFEARGEFRFYGKDMVTYVLDLTKSDRVRPVSRHPAV